MTDVVRRALTPGRPFISGLASPARDIGVKDVAIPMRANRPFLVSKYFAWAASPADIPVPAESRCSESKAFHVSIIPSTPKSMEWLLA